jgi:type IV secretory pathway TrbF-like protein
MAKGIENNSYAQSLALWDDLYGSVQMRLQNAYRVIACLSVAVVITVISLMAVSLKASVKPYVALLRGDELISVRSFRSAQDDEMKPQLAMHLAKQFIIASRSVTLDNKLNQQHHVQAYSFIAGAASGVLKSYFANRDVGCMQDIAITTILLKSLSVMDIRWKETKRNRQTGEVVSSNHYSAELTYAYHKPSQDLVVAEHNPFGFYITQLVWTKDRAIN